MTPLRILSPLLVSVITLSAAAGDNGFQLMRNEFIGVLKLGITREQAIQALGAASKSGRLEEWGADGMFHQQLEFKSAGITLSLVSKTRSSSQTVESITVVAPCRSRTRMGIRIGSTEADVMKAYKAHHNKEESTPGSCFVAGSTSGGISFQITNGKVSQIFIGAAGE